MSLCYVILFRRNFCGVEVWRGGLGGTYQLPTLSSVGASLFPPCFRFHTPLIEPDVRICRMKCAPAHLMRYVVSPVMWRSACKIHVLNAQTSLSTT